MYTSSDYRSIARIALRGKWIPAAVTAFTASLIGATIGTVSGGSIQLEEDDLNRIVHNLSENELKFFQTFLLVFLVYTVIRGIVAFVIGGAGQLGYARYNLRLIDGEDAQISDLFSQFHRLGDGFLMVLLQEIFLLLWSFLFVIPGIIKAFSYAMTPYILYEHPEYSPTDAITESRRIMDGSKLDLFLLNLSFIGWALLSALPGVVGITGILFGTVSLWPLIFVTVLSDALLNAYVEAANAAFYRSISVTASQSSTPDDAEWN
ncbi:MAG: DUF975 family protein [Ruminococcaceae bacterium]|nr:DUF975 family protein [Oscillospiraceae bacterium]